MDMQGSKSARGFRLTCHKLGTGQIYKTTVFRYQTLGSIDWWSLREGISVREAQNCPGGFLCGGNFQTTGTQRRNQSEDCIPLRWVGRYQEAKTRRLRWLKFVRQSTEQKATKKKSFRNLHGEVGGLLSPFLNINLHIGNCTRPGKNCFSGKNDDQEIVNWMIPRAHKGQEIFLVCSHQPEKKRLQKANALVVSLC